jgi:nitrogen fixation/metabolism regulation signal transduction histidine kinase
LTPIQLSAERLEHKLAGKLQGPDLVVLTKSVKTIVDQVDAMKRLVNEFRDYARLPAAELQAVDINALVTDILQLYEPGADQCLVSMELDPACPMVRGDPQQLRQVIHNLVQNGQDATDANSAKHEVIVRTQWQERSGRVRLSVLDHGAGFSDNILKRAFEPYITTKTRGTGLGLAVVKKIADEHGARIDIGNRTQDGVVVGAQVSLSLNTYASASA